MAERSQGVSVSKRISAGLGRTRLVSLGLGGFWRILPSLCRFCGFRHLKGSQHVHAGLDGSKKVLVGLSGSRWVSIVLNKSLQGLAGLCGYRYINGSLRVRFWWILVSQKVSASLGGSRQELMGLSRFWHLIGSHRVSPGLGGPRRVSASLKV